MKNRFAEICNNSDLQQDNRPRDAFEEVCTQTSLETLFLLVCNVK